MIVVTGASGLVGGNLVRALLSQGRPVRALVHHDRRALEGLDVETASADLNDLASLEQAFRGAQVVYHLASTISIRMETGTSWSTSMSMAHAMWWRPACTAAYVGCVLQFHPRLSAEPYDGPLDEGRPSSPMIVSRPMSVPKPPLNQLRVRHRNVGWIPSLLFPPPSSGLTTSAPPTSDKLCKCWCTGTSRL